MKKVFSILFVLALALALSPLMAFAEGETEPARATISGTVYYPEGCSGKVSVSVYVNTPESEETHIPYWASVSLEEGESKTYQIAIPVSDTSETCQIYYSGPSTNCMTFMYLMEDGTFVKNGKADLPVADRTLDIRPEMAPIVVQGKIYFPDDYVFCDEWGKDSVEIDLAVYNTTPNGTSGQIHNVTNYKAENLMTDAEGHKYVPYELRFGDYIYFDSKFCFQYRLRDDYGAMLTEDVYFFIMPDGSLDDSVQKQSPHDTFDYDYKVGQPVTIDFALCTWDERGPYVCQSPHGLRSGDYTFTYKYPGDADSIKLYFDRKSDSPVYINGTPYSISYSDYTVEIEGTTAEIKVNFSEWNHYGFAVAKVKGKTKPTAPSVTDLDAHGNRLDLMKDLKETKRLSAEVYTGDMATGASIKGFAALYDESGRFIGLTTANGAATESGETGLEFSFSEMDKAAASVKVMVTDEALTPAGQSLGSDEE